MTKQGRLETILVATDFSEHASVALERAAEIAERHGARIVLVHAVMAIAPTAPEFIPVPVSFYEELRELAEEQLAKSVGALRERGLTVESRVMAEPATTAVLEAASDLDADLIVVGTRGATGLKRLLLGSTAARIVREAPCPVLSVPTPPEGGTRPVRNVLVATDFSDDAAAAARAALRLVGDRPPEDPASVVLLHVYRYPSALSRLEGEALVEAIASTDESARRELEALAEKLRRPGVAIEIRAEAGGEPAESILERAQDLGVDAIALGTHGRSGLKRLFLGSTAERVLPAAHCPVLTVHLPKDDA